MMSVHLKKFWKLFQIITEHYKALVASPQTDHYFAWCSVLFVPTIVICHWEATRRRAKKNQDKIYGAAGRRSVLTMLLRKSDTNINIKLWLNICILSWLEIYILSLSLSLLTPLSLGQLLIKGRVEFSEAQCFGSAWGSFLFGPTHHLKLEKPRETKSCGLTKLTDDNGRYFNWGQHWFWKLLIILLKEQ